MFLFNHSLASGLDLALVSFPFTSCRWAVTRCRETGNLDFANDSKSWLPGAKLACVLCGWKDRKHQNWHPMTR